MAKSVRSPQNSKPETANDFREMLGKKDFELMSLKVDDLRKIASKLNVTGSHDMKKGELVSALDKARKEE